MTVGLIVLLAAFLLLDRAHGASNEIADRQDAVQRGRQAMELLTRQIRSQVCLGDFDGADHRRHQQLGHLLRRPQRRQQERRAPDDHLRPDGARRSPSSVYPGVGTYPDLTFPGYPGSRDATSTILTKAEAVTSPATPFLRYYAYRPRAARPARCAS